jgi:uncharacterized membrane protein
MKVIRTRIVVALASSAVMASGLGLTALAAGSANAGTAMSSASGAIVPPCLNTTIYDQCTNK